MKPETGRMQSTGPMAWSPLGAQVLTLPCGGHELFYLSPLSRTTLNTVPARGGVPVLFPQFADRGPLKKHGWARDMVWTVVPERATDSSAGRWVQQLDLSPTDKPEWPHAARLTLSAHVQPHCFEMSLTVENTGGSAFAWTGGLHPYWATDDLLATELHGLSGAKVQDRYQPERAVEGNRPVRWTGAECERLYDTAPPVLLKTPSHTIELSMTGFDQWMVWNPGQQGAVALADLPDGDWQRFVCIEPVLVCRPSRLEPGQTFEGSFRVQLV